MRTRGLTAALVAAMTGALVFTTGGAAHAAPEPPVAVVCPDHQTYTLNSVAGGCQTIETAITNASVSAGPTRIEMMPGEYCPFQIGFGIQPLTIVGVGAAGISTGQTITGPPAALTTVTWDSGFCSGSAPNSVISLPSGRYEGNGINPATVTIQNITVAAAATPTDGPTTGLDAPQGGELVLRDMIFQGAGSVGLHYQTPSGDSTDAFSVQNSLFSNNTGNAIDASTVDPRGATSPVGTIAETTIDSNGTGLTPHQGPISLINDTIAHNGAGINVSDTNGQVLAKNTIVGDNGSDCFPTGFLYFGVWESGGSFSNATNMTDSSCLAEENTDVSFTGSLPATADNGGPTPSILPPAGAVGAATASYCNSTGSDQREFLYTAASSCDIGAVDTTTGSASPTGAANPASPDFGTVLLGQQPQKAILFSNSGGGQLGISGVEISADPSDYQITQDLCTFDLLLTVSGQTCEVDIKFAPSVAGSHPGTLTFDTTAGPVNVNIAGSGGATANTPTSPTKVKTRPGSLSAQVSWTAGTAGASDATVTGYDTQYSDDGGTTWTHGPSTGPDTFDTNVGELLNGTTYIFEVDATSTIGDSDWSAPSDPVTPEPPPTDHTALSAPHSRTVQYGHAGTIAATLTDTTTAAPLPGAMVSIQARSGHSGPFTVLGSNSTGGDGVVSFPIRPKFNAQYQLTYAGDVVHFPSVSAIATVKVAQVVTATLKPRKVTRHHTVRIFGTVTPNANGKVVVLQRLVAGRWHKLRGVRVHRQTLPNGRTMVGYVVRFTPRYRGIVKLRVARGATRLNVGGVSLTNILRVT